MYVLDFISLQEHCYIDFPDTKLKQLFLYEGIVFIKILKLYFCICMYIDACHNHNPILPKMDSKSMGATRHGTFSVYHLGLNSWIINYTRRQSHKGSPPY